MTIPLRHTAPRTARQTTAMGIAAALLGMPRVKQSVRIVSRDTLHGITFFSVAVNEGPERYRVSQAFLDRLYAGQSPQSLQLEDEPMEGPFEPEYADEDRASSVADRLYQSKLEEQI